jgi:hypothetical protein
LFVFFVVFVLGRLRNIDPERGANAIWIGPDWTHEAQDDAAVAGLVENLRARQIGSVYTWLSWLQGDLTWNNADRFDAVKAFVAQFKRLYPEAELLAWIDFPADVGRGYRLQLIEAQDLVVQFSREAVAEFGFDGVFLNISPVLNDDDNFLAVLRRVRASMREGAVLAAAVPPDWTPENADIPIPGIYAPGTVWSEAFKQSAALLLDEMVLMGFDSGLMSSSDYSLWLAYQVETYARAVDALGDDMTTTILVALPAHDPVARQHDPLVENINSAADGILLGVQRSEEAGVYVRGGALYTEWMTDQEEWGQWEQSWLRRRG